MALMCLMPLQSVDFTFLDETSQTKESGPGPEDILLMGNSYIGSNSLHNLVDGVMNAASQPANVSALSGGGMRLSQHASNVASAGHQWNTTLNNGNWDWVVLQDQSQIPGFPRSQQEWIDSKDGAVELAEVIEDNDAEVILMMTWGRRDGDSGNAWRFPDFSTMQDELEAGYTDYQDNITANGGHAWMAPVGLAFEHIHDKVVAEGGTPTNSGNLFYDLYSGDGSHPSLAGSYLAACVLYATITGDDPVGLTHTTSLSNSVVLELQQAAAATVFNETSHISYSWQTNSGGGNQNPPMMIPANQTLAWESAFSFGSDNEDHILDAEYFGNHFYVYGKHAGNFSIGSSPNCIAKNNATSPTNYASLFVAKIDLSGNCIWISYVSSNSEHGAYGHLQGDFGKISIDSQGNVFIVGQWAGAASRVTWFGNESFNPGNGGKAFVAKLDHNGVFEWVNALHESCYCGIDADSNGNVWVSSYSSSPKRAWIYKYDANGTSLFSTYLSGSLAILIDEIKIDSMDNVYFAGAHSASFSVVVNGTSQTIPHDSGSGYDMFIAKMNSTEDWQWFATPTISTSTSRAHHLEIHNDNTIYVSGYFYAEFTIGNSSFDSGGTQNGFIAAIDSTGSWQWENQLRCSCTVDVGSISVDNSGNLYATGSANNGVVQIGNISISPQSANRDGFVAKLSPSGEPQWGKSFGGLDHDFGTNVMVDDNDTVYNAGTFEAAASLGSLSLNAPSNGNSMFIAKMSRDYDDDGNPDISDFDDDSDLIGDNIDLCHYSPLGFKSTTALDHDGDGCHDILEDEDDDNDGLNDSLDDCPKGMIQWERTNNSDVDGDGCMDALEDYDDDNDGFEDYLDHCPRLPGNSTYNLEQGCPDSDGDTRPDIHDPFPYDETEWSDIDGDGIGDNLDDFPNDATQQWDSDHDGFGDSEYGNFGDSCPSTYGNSTIDRYGCIDSDGDGWSDEGDDFPNDPDEYLDSDSDGYPDSSDDFPYDPTQWKDSDSDGYGDNPEGNSGDVYPNDPTKHADSDRDGIDDSTDKFPFDPTQWEDADGDGMGDNPMGIGADHFPDDITQWGDIDGDGYGDNQSGNNPDAFPIDSTQWSDIDGDGYGDNPAGRLYDQFPNNPTQWVDEDGDGLGDNQSGTDADPYLNDLDNDGYNDTVDILPRFASPGDLDADGCLDEVDAFKDNALECLDTDGDGIGNNADADDDNDLVTDADEIRAGTDPLDPNETPVDSFEIQIGNIGLGAWDLIGIFGGIPIFAWLAFGFITRNSRCARYEEQLEEAGSREELEQVALKWEYSLMLRLLGPHQGIRLERLRSELDDKFENAELLMASEDFEPLESVDHTPIVEAEGKDVPELDTSGPPLDAEADQIDENGYSWLQFEGKQWYRTSSDSQWNQFED